MKVDREATEAMHFLDKDSYVALDGRHIYHGQDAEAAREKAWREWDGKCFFCLRPVLYEPEEWHHIKSKGRYLRDDHPRNRAFGHSACHKAEHNREPKWSKPAVAEGVLNG